MNLKYIAFLPVFLISASPVLAIDVTPSPTYRQEVKQERQENKESRQQTRCQVIGLKLDQTIKNYQTRKDLHVLEYQRLHDRLVTVSERLSSKGVDVSKLTTDLSTLSSKVAKLSSDYQAFVTELSSSRDQACTLTLDEVKAKLTATRAQLQAFRTESKAIHEFIKSTIRKDLLDLRASKPISE